MTIVKAIIDDIVSACRTLGVKCDYDKSQVGEEGTFNNFVNNSVLFSIDQGQNSITLNINYVFKAEKYPSEKGNFEYLSVVNSRHEQILPAGFVQQTFQIDYSNAGFVVVRTTQIMPLCFDNF